LFETYYAHIFTHIFLWVEEDQPVNDLGSTSLSGSALGTAVLGIVPLADVEELGWQERALCAQTDPEAFFPEKGGSTREAKKVCLSCEVRVECLEYALEQDERFGIWGGLSERERRRLKKRAVS
jgi:WhiB family redox-sensing transcriptional regulator